MIHVVQDAVYASALQFRIFGTGVGKDLFLFIIGPEVKEDLAIRGEENFLIAIFVVIVSSRGVYVRT